MVIDSDVMLHALVSRVVQVGDKVSNVVHSDDFVGELGGAILSLGVILAIGYSIRRWIKRKGYRMVVRDRNDKIHALLLDIFQDGVDHAVEIGKLSNQEAERAFTMLARGQLKLRDLVPKKRIARHVKSELKTTRQKRALLGDTKPLIPGDKPPRIVPKALPPAPPVAKKSFWQRLPKL